MNAEEINKMLEEIKPDIQASLKKELLQSITWEAKQEATRQIQKCISDFIAEEILPEVKKDLIESKESLVSIGIKAAPMIVDEIAKAMCKSVADKLGQSYSRDSLFASLFK